MGAIPAVREQLQFHPTHAALLFPWPGGTSQTFISCFFQMEGMICEFHFSIASLSLSADAPLQFGETRQLCGLEVSLTKDSRLLFFGPACCEVLGHGHSHVLCHFMIQMALPLLPYPLLLISRYHQGLPVPILTGSCLCFAMPAPTGPSPLGPRAFWVSFSATCSGFHRRTQLLDYGNDTSSLCPFSSRDTRFFLSSHTTFRGCIRIYTTG